MLTYSRGLFFSLLALAGPIVVALPSSALAQSWKATVSGENRHAEVASRQPGGLLRIECELSAAIWLRYYPARGWDGGARAAIRIGNYTSAMEIDGGDGALLSNLPNKDIGVTRELIEALRTGPNVVIEGPAAARIPLGQRTFGLANAAAAIGAVQSRCGAQKGR